MIIQTNEKGSRHIEVSDSHLQTIDRYQLFRNLIDSHGIIDEDVLEKLRLNTRALLESSNETPKDLLSLCFDVLYHNNMKAYGLRELIQLYINWKETNNGTVEPQCEE